ncbi:MAG: HEAT repeat domain-containing protein [Rhodopirellula sp.]|nr:HEAT repeat domain-containing protein [Rhodopirellula sp.]
MSRRRHVFCIAAVGMVALLPSLIIAQQVPPAEGDEAALVAVLKSDADLFQKAKACQRLAVIGKKECIPALAGLLGDERLSHYARYGLEPNPDPAAGAALRDALEKLQGGLLVGAINSVGMRRDTQATAKLKDFLGNSDPQIVAASATALARINTPDAVAILTAALSKGESQRPAVAAACLTAADVLFGEGKKAEAKALFDTAREADVPKHIKIAALEGAIRARGADGLPMLVQCLQSPDDAVFQVALAAAHALPGAEVTKTLIEELPKLAPAAEAVEKVAADAGPYIRQALLIYVLGDRGDKAALPAVLELAKSAPYPVRLPAVRVLAELGDAAAIPVLLEAAHANEGELAEAARESLIELEGEAVNAKLVGMLDDSQGQKLLELVVVLGKRGVAAAEAKLTKLADSEDPEVRQAAMAALGSTVGLDGFAGLIDRLVKADSPETAAVVKDALQRGSMRVPDREASAAVVIEKMRDAPAHAKADLLDLLGIIGGTKALKGVAAAAGDSSDEIQEAATRVLGEWMSADAAPVLLELTKSGSEKYRVRTLRGYLRIARQLDVPVEERVAMCRKALDAAGRDDEKKLALEVLGRYPSAESLALVVPYLDAGGLKESAAAAAVAISEKLAGTAPAAVAEAMQKVVDNTGNAELKKKAAGLLRRAKK